MQRMLSSDLSTLADVATFKAPELLHSSSCSSLSLPLRPPPPLSTSMPPDCASALYPSVQLSALESSRGSSFHYHRRRKYTDADTGHVFEIGSQPSAGRTLLYLSPHPIPAGQTICSYAHRSDYRLMSLEEYDEHHAALDPSTPRYGVEWFHGQIAVPELRACQVQQTDGSVHYSNLGIIANTALSDHGVGNNARYKRSAGTGRIALEATRKINPGEEVLVSYGRSMHQHIRQERQVNVGLFQSRRVDRCKRKDTWQCNGCGRQFRGSKKRVVVHVLFHCPGRHNNLA